MRTALFGAAPDTGNLGVSALSQSVVQGLAERLAHGSRIALFDNGLGLRPADPPAHGVELVRLGARLSRKYHLPESYARINLALTLGDFLSQPAREIKHAHAVLDISGGDSFTDLYGPKRLAQVLAPKHFAFKAHTPLILLPQTYGPFDDPANRDAAANILHRCALAYARDQRSFDVLTALVGDRFDPARHKLGVDVAFLLKPDDHAPDVPDDLLAWLDDGPVVGFNVSGLIYSDPDETRRRFRFRADYRQLVHRALRTLLDRGERVLLMPHVLGPPDQLDSDTGACDDVRAHLDASPDAVRVAAGCRTAAEAKGLIRRCAWFCGTRMHATIAALSSGVPTATISYSPKAQGVFDLCDAGDAVVDPTALDTDAAFDAFIDTYERRDDARTRLHAALPAVIETARQQMDDIVAHIPRPGPTPTA